MGLLFFLYPFGEIYAWYLFISKYSFGDAIFLVITTGALGYFIMTLQGKATLLSMQASLTQGKMPAGGILNRGAIMVGGVFLMIPGLISKVMGVLFVFPGSRHILIWGLKIYIAEKIAKGAFQVFTNVSGKANDGNFHGGFGRGFGGGFYRAGGTSTTTEVSREMRDVVDIQPTRVEHQPKTQTEDE